MARIYISHSGIDNRLNQSIRSALINLEHEIADPTIELGTDLKTGIKAIIDSASIFLILISKESLGQSKRFYDEMIQLRNYATHTRNKMLIPIFIGNLPMNELPESIVNIQGLRIYDEEPESIINLVKRVDEAISLFFGKSLAKEEEKKVIKEKIDNNAPKYIEKTLEELTTRENRFRVYGMAWYLLGFFTLLTGVGTAI